MGKRLSKSRQPIGDWTSCIAYVSAAGLRKQREVCSTPTYVARVASDSRRLDIVSEELKRHLKKSVVFHEETSVSKSTDYDL